jgi:hypothetical protein
VVEQRLVGLVVEYAAQRMTRDIMATSRVPKRGYRFYSVDKASKSEAFDRGCYRLNNLSNKSAGSESE